MDIIAIDPLGDGIVRNYKPGVASRVFAEGLWCDSTLSPDVHVRVGWDGLINRAYDNGDPEPSGHWIAS